MKKISIYILSLGILSLLMGFCVNPFAPKLEKSDQQGLIITEQKTPDEVLQNFKYAYVFKDSVLYADLLDSSFVFIFFDPEEQSSGSFMSWGRDVDLTTTGRLFRNFDVIDLIWNSTVYSILEEDRAEMSKSFHLTLSKDNESISVSGDAIFLFAKNQFDGKWRILQWKDESDL
ncbi:MAG: hypothetical protein GXO74_13500 [Calditrichaeota bacterium]|nr:hypothetical protein [Calditrichota bacterium]